MTFFRTCCLLVGALALLLISGAQAQASADGLAAELERLRSQDQRVAAAAYRIRTKNMDLCPRHAVLAGWTLHNAPQYGPRLREAAAVHFGFDGSNPSVMAVVAGGPAAAAGVRPDDVVVAVNGRTLGASAPTKGKGDFSQLESDLELLDAALAAGPVELLLRRQGVGHVVTLTGAPGCAHEAQVNPSSEIQASADGNRVFVTTALVDFAADDDELAFVLAHEYAHNFLGHRNELDRKGFARGVLGPLGSAPWDIRRTEREADRFAVYLLARAGYDISAAPRFFERLGRATPSSRLPQWGHASVGSRMRRLQETVAEVRRKVAEGTILVPGAP